MPGNLTSDVAALGTVQLRRSFSLKVWKTQQRGEEIVYMNLIDMYPWGVKDGVKDRRKKDLPPHPLSAGSEAIAQLPGFSEMSKTSKEAMAYNTKAEPVP